MLSGIIQQAQISASRTARAAALGAGAFVCLGIGLAFLTVAAWIFLTSVSTSLQAAVIIGCGYVGFGFLLLVFSALSKRRKVVSMHATPAPASTELAMAQVIAAFMSGIAAGRKARS